MFKKTAVFLVFRPASDRVTLALIHMLIHKLALLLKANLPIIQCVELLEKSEQSLCMQKLLYFSKKDLYAGKKISESFLYFSDYVEPIFFHLLRVGEETGKLISTVDRLSRYLGEKVQFQRKIQQALFYPAVILLVALLLFFALLIFIIPEFAGLFSESHMQLPLYTQIIFNIAISLKESLFYVLLAMSIVCFLMLKAKFYVSIQRVLTTLLSFSRFAKRYQEKRYLAQFCEQLALCLSAGLPLTEGLALLQLYGVYSQYRMIADVTKRIKAGVSLSEAMETYACFSPFMIEMVKIGEASGTLADIFLYLANYYHDELDAFLVKIKTLIEPLIICMLGVLIGCLVLSIYLPIFKLGSLWQ